MNPILPVGNIGLSGAGQVLPQAPGTEDKEDFLKLLVAQMSHQDPLSPLEGTEFAAQLAQFSSLEELRNLGVKLDNALNADMLLARSINNTMAATLIGKDVRAVDNTVHLTGEGNVNIQFELRSLASEVKIEILDETGKVLHTITKPNLGKGDQNVEWNGRDARGNLVPPGDYYVRISATLPGGSQIQVDPLAMGRVESVRFIDGNPVLIVQGREIPFGAVLQIMEPQNNADDGGSWLTRMLREGN